jgi:CheY-like chemotaxis protein
MTTGTMLLVVEDDSITREGLGLLLRREDYGVIQAANGEEALACLRSGPRPDLILWTCSCPCWTAGTSSSRFARRVRHPSRSWL